MNRWNVKPTLVVVALLALGAAGNANAGLLLLSGDSNMGAYIASEPDNATWFSNILGAGSNVLVQHEQGDSTTIPSRDGINDYYDSLPGVTSSLFSGGITAAALAGVDLFVSMLPGDDYVAAEIGALGTFLDGGGTLFLTGDGQGFAGVQNGRLNALLSALGSSMSLGTDGLNAGPNTTSNVDADPLNAGVSTFTFSYTNSVAGGTSLLRTNGGNVTFIAYENTGQSVPEPGPMALLALGLSALALGRRRRR